MNKYLFEGLVCGGIFASVITWVAASDAIAVGGFALLASAVFGLAAGLCIGGLIAANFAMFAVEEKEWLNPPPQLASRIISGRTSWSPRPTSYPSSSRTLLSFSEDRRRKS